MSETTESTDHLPSRIVTTPEARKSKILLPGEVDDIRKKIALPGDSKILLSPIARKEAEARRQRAEAEQGFEYATKFNHQQRRWHLRYAAKMRRRATRAGERKQRRLEEQIHLYATQQYDASLRRTVRSNSRGETLKVIQRPAIRQIRIEGGYLNSIEFRDGKLVANGAPLRKSKVQLELEANVRLGVYPQATITKTHRLKGSWAPPKPKKKEPVAA